MFTNRSCSHKLSSCNQSEDTIEKAGNLVTISRVLLLLLDVVALLLTYPEYHSFKFALFVLFVEPCRRGKVYLQSQVNGKWLSSHPFSVGIKRHILGVCHYKVKVKCSSIASKSRLQYHMFSALC